MGNQGLDPAGLVYDVSPLDYLNLLCSMKLQLFEISMITKLDDFDCSNRSSDLNYPSFVAFYCDNNTTLKEKRFQSTVTNVGISDGTTRF